MMAKSLIGLNEETNASMPQHHHHLLPPPSPVPTQLYNNSSPTPSTQLATNSITAPPTVAPTQLMICVRCLQPITEPFLLLVGASLPFHTHCLTCAECACPLNAAAASRQHMLTNFTSTDTNNNVAENNGDFIPHQTTQQQQMLFGDDDRHQFCGTCFFRDGDVYCRTDYVQRFVKTSCAKCTAPLATNECVMRVEAHVLRAADHEADSSTKSSTFDRKPGESQQQFRSELRHFHVSCFTCSICQQLLQRGELYRYVATANMLLCKDHIDQVPFDALQRPHSPPRRTGLAAGVSVMRPKPQGKVGRPRKRKVNSFVGESLEQRLLQQPATEQQLQQLTPTNNIYLCQAQPGSVSQQMQSTANNNNSTLNTTQQQPQSQRSKRMRTSFKHQQLKAMKTFFTCNQNPDAKDLKQLSSKTGLSKRVLQVWFQNARAKNRRHYAKARQHETSQQQTGSTSTTQLLQQSSSSSFLEQLGAAVSAASRDNGNCNVLSKNSTIPAVQSLPAPPPPPPPLPSLPLTTSFYHQHHRHIARQQHHQPASPPDTFIGHNNNTAHGFSASTFISNTPGVGRFPQPNLSLGNALSEAAGEGMINSGHSYDTPGAGEVD